MTTAFRELPNLPSGVTWQQAIESNGPGCITDSGVFEHATAHQQSDTALYFVWTDLVCGPSRPCRLRQLQRAFSAATNTNFRNHFSDKRQRAGWHRNEEFHRYSHE